MKRIASFIVDRRYWVLSVMLLLCVLCGLMIPRVELITDMSEFLPKDSSMKIGMELMEEEFPDSQTTSTIRVMFRGLSEEEKPQILERLEALEYVDSVDYDAETGNKDGYTLYTVSTVYNYESPEELALEQSIADTFASYDMTYKNNNTASATLPAWLVILAFSLLTLVLFVMCGSWLEPFLFLVTVAIAIVLNMGSNILLGRVSQMTFSVAAILQVALSMDYSIILMNRFRQEKGQSPTKYEAMKKALRYSFSSICSSGMTTLIGLVMLVFMRFQIGRDIGLVLAKGVLFSMICVFTVLPVLILLWSDALAKTRKKDLHIPMGWMSKHSFRLRRVFAGGFVLLFIVSAFLQTKTGVFFSLVLGEDPIADVFPTSNPIVLLYENQDEEQVSLLTQTLEKNENIRSATGYVTTLGKSYTADEMADTIDELGDDMEIDPSLLSILYYDRFAGDVLPELTVSRFVTFVRNTVADNETFAPYLDEDMKAQLDQMEKFSDTEALTAPMTAGELAGFFELDAALVEQVFLLYYSEQDGVDTGAMTLSAFVDFVMDEVAGHETYGDMLPDGAVSQLQSLAMFTDPDTMTAALPYTHMADALNMDEEQMKLLYIYYYAQSDSYQPTPMSLSQFLWFMENDVAADPMLSAQLDEAAMAQLSRLSALADPAAVQLPLPAAQLAGALGLDQALVEQLFLLRFGAVEGQYMSMEEFVNFLLSDVVTNPAFAGQFDEATVQQLAFTQQIIQATLADADFSHDQMAALLGMDAAQMKLLYTYRDSSADTGAWALSLYTVVDFLIDNSGQFGSMLGQNELAQLKQAQTLMDASRAGTRYTAGELAALLDMDAEQTEQLYLLYTSEHGDTSGWVLSPQGFVDFLVDDVLSGETYRDMLDEASAEDLTAAQTLIHAVTSGQTYSAGDLTDLLNSLTEELDGNTVELIYLYHAALNESDDAWTLSIDQLFTHLNDDMLTDPRFDSLIDDAMRADVAELKSELDDGISQMRGEKYSLLMLDTVYPVESEETTTFLSDLTAYCETGLQGDFHLIGDSPMNYEMSQDFGREQLTITLLTAIAIFLVVAVTFRSLLIPLILVLIVQCGVYITIAGSGLLGYDMYYLAMIIVQCILMGATIDYGILFTNYYREHRRHLDVTQALHAAYDGSTHTIFTSGLIMVLVTGVIGVSKLIPIIPEICQAIAIGAASAMVLILFVLPSLLAAFDRFVVKKKDRAPIE